MMVRALVGGLCLVAFVSPLAAGWKPAESRLMTRWAKDVDPANPLPESPRPQFQRDTWQSLNGQWDYAITDKQAGVPEKWDGQILVPFAVESALSGVGKTVGHVLDVHRYPGPFLLKVTPEHAAVLGEYGGLGRPIEGHTWLDKGNWGYRSFESKEALADADEQLADQLPEMIGNGLTTAISTQTTDVEIETNGLFTYDREVLKFEEKRMREANLRVYGPTPTFTVLVPTSEETPQTGRNTLSIHTHQTGGGQYHRRGNRRDAV